VLVVLALVSIALGVTYALLRSQSAMTHIPKNAIFRSSARQAAVSGLAIGMRTMSRSTWSGANSTITGTLDGQSSYTVTFSPGDPTLAATDINQAFRVTLASTGVTINPDVSSQPVSFRARAVMRLAPKQLNTEPMNWPTLLQYTVAQIGSSPQFFIDPPAQVQGTVRVEGQFGMGSDIAMSVTQFQRFYGDENAMRQAGVSDCRPLTGAVSIRSGAVDAQTSSYLTSQLGLTLTTITPSNSTALPVPSQLTTYQIYPGGPTYQVTAVGSSLANVSYAPDPVHNPLGILFSSNNVAIGDNVSIAGTLICGGNVNITGSGVSLQPVTMPPLWGTTAPVRLPALACTGSFYCAAGINVSVIGTIVSGSQFTIDQGSQNDRFSLKGHLIAYKDVQIKRRNEWNILSLVWGTDYTLFTTQLLLPRPPGIAYFPVYLTGLGINANPLLTIVPDSTLFADHWQDLTAGTIVVVPSADNGLRWELVSWTENL
jgi:hypothetical protein